MQFFRTSHIEIAGHMTVEQAQTMLAILDFAACGLECRAHKPLNAEERAKDHHRAHAAYSSAVSLRNALARHRAIPTIDCQALKEIGTEGSF